MVDGTGRDRQHDEGRQDREQRHQVEHGALPQRPADQPGDDADEDIAGAVTGGVAGQARGQTRLPHEPERDRRHRRCEHRPQHGHDDVRREHDRQRRRPGDRQRACRQRGDAGDEQAALEAGGVDQGADRRVERDADQPARGEHRTEGRLVPVRLGKQEHPDVRTEPAAHVGQEEVQPVELRAIGHPTLLPPRHSAIVRPLSPLRDWLMQEAL